LFIIEELTNAEICTGKKSVRPQNLIFTKIQMDSLPCVVYNHILNI